MSTENQIPRGAIPLVIGGVFAVVLLICGGCCTVPGINPGHVGIVKTWSKYEDRVLPEGGPYWVSPISTVERVSVKTVKNEEAATVPTKGGLSVELHAILVYKPQPNRLPDILRQFGPKYEEVIIDPTFRNVVRDVCAEHTPEDLYTVARNDVESQILARVQKELEPSGFSCEKVMVQDPKLPSVVTERIQAKVAAEQDAIRMQSVYKQREQEAMANKRQKELAAEAQVIEAKGIADAQAIIQKDLSEQYLKYLHIQALTEAAKHNTSIIYVPVGHDGIPLVSPIKEKK